MRFASSDVIINFLMYLRRDYPVASRNFRKGWARRKHTNQLLFMSNILISWAKEYRFFRNYNRMLHHQFFFKNTYLSVNVVIQRTPHSDRTRHDTSVIGSAITRKSMKYFSNMFLKTRFTPFESFSDIAWTYASYPVQYDTSINAHAVAPFTPLFYVPKTSLVVLKEDINWALEWENLNSVLWHDTLSKITTLYSLLIKLLHFRLHR